MKKIPKTEVIYVAQEVTRDYFETNDGILFLTEEDALKHEKEKEIKKVSLDAYIPYDNLTMYYIEQKSDLGLVLPGWFLGSRYANFKIEEMSFLPFPKWVAIERSLDDDYSFVDIRKLKKDLQETKNSLDKFLEMLNGSEE